MRWVSRERHPGEVDLPLLFGGLLIVAGLAGGLWLRMGGVVPVCLFKKLTALPCPTCGGTRMAESLAYFHPGDAFLWNPLLFLVFVGILLCALVSGYRRLRGLPRIQPQVESKGEGLLLRLSALILLAAGWAYLIVQGI